MLPLCAQHRIQPIAGGKVPSGVPAQNSAVGMTAGLTRDSSGNYVFAEPYSNVIRRVSTNGMIDTIAGTGRAGYSGDGGPATAAQINWPESAHYDAAGNLYFIDSGNCRIRKIDTSGVITTVAGDGILAVTGMDATGPATLRSIEPVHYSQAPAPDLAILASGEVLFTQPRRGIVSKIAADGNLEVVAGIPDEDCCSFNGSDGNGDGGPAAAAHLYDPGPLAVDAKGNVYVGFETGQVRRISTDGIITEFAGASNGSPNAVPPDGAPAPNAYFGAIATLSAGTDGSLYIATDITSNQLGVWRVDPSGTVNPVPGASYIIISGIVPNADGTLMLATSYSLSSLGTDGTLTWVAGQNPKIAPDGTPAINAWLDGPTIATDPSGHLYISESGACTIRNIDAEGLLRTVAGTGECSQQGATQAPAAGPNLPSAVSMAVDSSGRVYLADTWGYVYAIAQDGTYSVIFQPTQTTYGDTELATDAKNRVYVLQLLNLYRISPDGTTETLVSASGTVAGFSSLGVYALGTDPSHSTVYLDGQSTGDSYTIFRVNDDGTVTGLYNPPFIAGSSITADKTGSVWLSWLDLYKVDGSGGLHSVGLEAPTFWHGDTGPLQSAQLNAGQIVSSANGNLYFVDSQTGISQVSGSDPASAPIISPGGIVNAFSYTGTSVAPGELVSIFGQNFATTSGLQLNAAVNNVFPGALGDTAVTFDGLNAPVVMVTPTQIDVLAPGNLQAPTTEVVVKVDTLSSAPVSMPVTGSAFGLASADASGAGPGAILNQDGSVNTAAHPAERGSTISLFGTGVGKLSQSLPDGALVISTPYPTAQNPVSVTIGGQPAQVQYAGAAPFEVFGVVQINVVVPAGVTPGSQDVVVTVGNASPSKPVTIAVR